MFIGRFQPFHNGHKAVVEEALKRAEHVIVLVGSPNQPRSIRNPFTFTERTRMIRDSFGYAEGSALTILPLADFPYADDLWVANVQRMVFNEAALLNAKRIGLIGHSKDASSYYLKLFPTWGSVEVENVDGLSATPIREMYLTNAVNAVNGYDTVLPANVHDFLSSFAATDDYKRLAEEHQHVAEYKASWARAPYPPTFVTVDAVVVQSGHILLVERGAQPGKGLWALPGGFLNRGETLIDGAIRELREETRLKVPEPVLRGSLVHTRVFDDPNRSARGRTITHAFLFHLTPQLELPKVKGSDDAAKAKWVPLAAVDPKQMFEDHYAIIQRMTAVL